MIKVRFKEDFATRNAGDICEMDAMEASGLKKRGIIEVVSDKAEKKPESNDLNSLKVSELKELAKEKGVEGYEKMKKDQLIESLS